MAEPTLAPPPERGPTPPDLDELRAAAVRERVLQCDAPRNSGWRPGARWARADEGRWALNDTAAPKGQTRTEIEMQIAALPAHQRPPTRLLGRSSEAAAHPFKAMPPDEATPPVRAMARRTEAAEHPFRRLASDDGATLIARSSVPSVRFPGEGPDRPARRGSNDPHAAPPRVTPFFDTGRSMAGVVGNVAGPDRGGPGRRTGRTGEPRASVTPLVTTQKTGSRVEIAATSPAAAALGIEPGTALTQVRASVPDVVLRDADPAGDAAALEALAVLLARRWAPTVALAPPDGLFVDLTGVAHLYGGEARFAFRLVRMLARFGYTARVAIADTAGAAWALVRHGAGGAICPPGAHRAALGPLPITLLRLDPGKVALLHRMGVDTVAQFAALPRAPLVRRFGPAAARRLDQALGDAPEPLDPVVPAERIVVTQRFAEPIATADAIEHWLGTLVPRLTNALARAGLGGRALVLVADRVDHVAQVMRIGFARANRDPTHIRRLIVRRIEEIEPGYGIDALHLHVVRADPLDAQPFAERLDEATPDLAPLVDTLANRGAPSWRTRPVESDVPERAVARMPALDPPARAAAAPGRDDVRRLDTRAPEHPWQPRWPRPARLLRRPEPLDHIMAELPDLPPRRFTWRGMRHVVVRADGPERIAGEWWRGDQPHAVRDYFQVEDEAGERFWLFRRGDGERAETGDMRWYLHGRFG